MMEKDRVFNYFLIIIMAVLLTLFIWLAVRKAGG